MSQHSSGQRDGAADDAPAPSPQAHDEQAVADAFFKGNRLFYRRFRQDCLAQFPQDLHCGGRAMEACDLPGLLHLGHSLKTVLRLIGEPDLAALAQALEQGARQADAATCLSAWQPLQSGLQQLILTVEIDTNSIESN